MGTLTLTLIMQHQLGGRFTAYTYPSFRFRALLFQKMQQKTYFGAIWFEEI